MDAKQNDSRVRNARCIQERLHISGRLILETAAHFGGGQSRDDFRGDMALLLDEVDQCPLIPGTTIAGALRNYLRERLHNYAESEPTDDAQSNSPIAWLFGPVQGTDTYDQQSLLITEDALAVESTVSTTLRDGVRINPKTATAYVEDQRRPDGQVAKAGSKFDMALLEAGTAFDLHFEVLLTESLCAEKVLPFVAAALEGLESGEIRLGLRKRRGLGQCRVETWTVSRYNLMLPDELCLWLATPSLQHRIKPRNGKIANALDISTNLVPDNRQHFTIDATFSLDRSSMLIRSGFGEADIGPDAEHLHARTVHGKIEPIVSGTTWAGVMRHRALRIANTIAVEAGAVLATENEADSHAEELIRHLFGHMLDEQSYSSADLVGDEGAIIGRASRLVTDETTIRNGQSLYQTRVRIDRFTGGAYETGLYEQAPVYGKSDTTVEFRLTIRNPLNAEIGLMLLVLKDLWTSDLAVGGESSVGRGRLKGIKATLRLADNTKFCLKDAEEQLGLDHEQQMHLQGFVDALWNSLSPKQAQLSTSQDAEGSK